MSSNSALNGMLVVSIEQALAAPYCSCLLADAGARVIKIEREEGDFARAYDDVVDGESAYFVWANRGKESLTLNIKDETDSALLKRILMSADIFIQNLAPGAASRAGLDSIKLREQNSKLITVDISGYGEDGPARDMKAYDLLVCAEAGLSSITGTPAEPGRVGVSVCDIACGMFAHAAILEALIERGQTGLGKGIKVSLFDSIADWMTVPLLHQEYTGKSPERVGLNHPSIAPYGAYSCKGGAQVVISIQSEREWGSFCHNVLMRSELADSVLFSSNIARCENRPALDTEINKTFQQLSHDQLIERLNSANIAYGNLNSVADLSQHQQLRRTSVETPSGSVKLVSPPAIISTGVQQFRPVPALGADSIAIRNEFVNLDAVK